MGQSNHNGRVDSSKWYPEIPIIISTSFIVQRESGFFPKTRR